MIQDTLTAAALLSLPAAAEPFAFGASGLGSAAAPSNGGPFAHPGMLHSADDLRFMREKLAQGEEPWRAGWEKLKASPQVDLATVPKPVERVYRGVNNNPDIGSSALGHDSGAAYLQALMGSVTPDAADAEKRLAKSAEYLDAWAATLKSIDGHDTKLLCGLTGYRWANAAELLRASAPKLWTPERAAAVTKMLREVYLPPIHPFFPEANGNWDAAMMATTMSIAILGDDRPLFDRAVDWYLHGTSNGAITHYVYPNGQCEETTRDQGHVQLGLGMMETTCRIAWTQGVDLYGAYDNRLALGFEYTAKLNLGEPVPCDSGVPGPKGMGQFQPIYESAYNHYAIVKKLPMPYTRRVIEQKRPEGYDGSQPSFGTLTACREPNQKNDGDLLKSANNDPSERGIHPSSIDVKSPSNALKAIVEVNASQLKWSLTDSKGKQLVLPSIIAIAFEGGVTPLGNNLSLWEFTVAQRELPRPRLWGEHGEQNAADAPHLPFREVQLTLREDAAPHRIARFELRVYDAGVAMRIVLPPNRDAGTQSKGLHEQTEFALPETAIAYGSYWHEDEFHPTEVAELKAGAWLPMTVQTADSGPYLSILEVDETNAGCPQTLLSPSKTTKNAVVTEMRGPQPIGGEVSLPLPWRVVLYGETPAKLAEANRIVMSLWPESILPEKDTAWIKPGKAIREVTLSTPGGMACIDFAAANGLSYILYDAGWYGPEGDDASDARSVSLDPARIGPGHPGLDLQKVIAYGKERGIGVFLYVNRRALEKQLPELAPLYESWGVAGMKFGFVNTGTIEWTRWMRDSIALCAKHHLMVDVHDAYRPVGVSGLYPNMLTQEGIRGNEHMPTPRHNCSLPFTRFLTGPADYTVCYRNNRLHTTDAHQLALSVLYFSPFQMIYWYGQPKEYTGLPETELFKAVPTTWEETRWLGGEIGEFAIAARRSGRDWFIGAITNETGRAISIPLDFLPKDGSFTLRTYTDKRDTTGKPLATYTAGVSRIDIASRKVRHGDTLKYDLLPTGGAAFRLTADS